jgi:hypothetical protein
MRLPRFSIANGLAIIAILAVALAALRTPSYLWANVTYSLALGAVVVAIINVVYGREAGRAYWLGFSLCGGIYLTVCSAPLLRDSVCPRLVSETILDFLYPHLSPAQTTPLTIVEGWNGNGASVPTLNPFALSPFYSTVRTPVQMPVLAGPQPQSPVSRWADWTQPDRVISSRFQTAMVPLCSSEAFRQIGHSMFTLLVAVVGATFTRHRYRINMTDRSASQSAA